MITASQVAAIIMVLQAFGCPQSVIDSVRVDLTPSMQTVVEPTQPTQVVNTPSFGSTSTTTQVHAPVVVAPPPCDKTPILSLLTNPTSIDLEHNSDSIIVVTTEVKDACGMEYPYNLQMGSSTRIAGLSGRGVIHSQLTGGQMWGWENGSNPDVAAGTHLGNYPYPITLSTPTDSTTTYIEIQ